MQSITNDVHGDATNLYYFAADKMKDVVKNTLAIGKIEKLKMLDVLVAR